MSPICGIFVKVDGWTDRTDRQTTRLLELPWAAKKVEKKNTLVSSSCYKINVMQRYHPVKLVDAKVQKYEISF